MVDEVIEGVLEGAGKQLPLQATARKRGLVSMCCSAPRGQFFKKTNVAMSMQAGDRGKMRSECFSTASLGLPYSYHFRPKSFGIFTWPLLLRKVNPVDRARFSASLNSDVRRHQFKRRARGS